MVRQSLALEEKEVARLVESDFMPAAGLGYFGFRLSILAPLVMLGMQVLYGSVLGWVALSPYSDRCCYGGVADESVYVAQAARGRGVGRALLQAAIASSEAAGIWTLQAGVFPENAASLALHAACGFRVVGTRERLGRASDGRWRDVVLLERRSRLV